MGRYNIFTSLGWRALGAVIVIILAICCCFACSFPFLQAVNPTFTTQMYSPQGSIDVQIPSELSDFVTKKTGFTIPLAGNICLLQFPGVRTDPEGRIIDHYEFIIKCDTYKILALKATVMDTEKYWIYVEGTPIPATHDQLKDKIETLRGGKSHGNKHRVLQPAGRLDGDPGDNLQVGPGDTGQVEVPDHRGDRNVAGHRRHALLGTARDAEAGHRVSAPGSNGRSCNDRTV